MADFNCHGLTLRKSFFSTTVASGQFGSLLVLFQYEVMVKVTIFRAMVIVRLSSFSCPRRLFRQLCFFDI